jgi:pyruvate ferredoxin oxidoreductase alpha subunit
MVCLDGFFLSHMSQAVIVPDQETVDAFLPPYEAKNLKLDLADPMFINNLTPSTEFMEMRYQQDRGFNKAMPVIKETMADFGAQFGRSYQVVEAYCCEDAEAILITLGSMSGSVKHMVDQYRGKGKKVGNIRIVSFRPFPVEELAALIPPKARVGVLDRSMSFGAQAGPVCLEVRSALADSRQDVKVQPYVVGLGGRDVRPVAVTTALDQLLRNHMEPGVRWLDISEKAMEMRHYAEVA